MEQFFSYVLGIGDLQKINEWIIRIFISAFFGFCLGWERRNRQQIIGIRTLLLISISSTLLGILSEYVTLSVPHGAAGDPGRISAAVVTGIGFVGGGAILHRGLNVKGITTAALIWAVAALGLALGDGLYIPAFFVFIIIIVCLPIFQKFESLHFSTAKMKFIRVQFLNFNSDYNQLELMLKQNNIIISDLSITNDVQNNLLEFTFSVFIPRKINFIDISNKFKEKGNLVHFSISDS